MNALKKEKLKKKISDWRLIFSPTTQILLSLKKEMMYYYSSDFLRRPKQFDKNFSFASLKFMYSEKATKFEDILGFQITSNFCGLLRKPQF